MNLASFRGRDAETRVTVGVMPAEAAWVGAMVTAMLGGGAGIPFRDLGETDPEREPGIGYVRPRIQFTWEKAPLEYGEPGSRRSRGSVVPELEVGALVGGGGWDVYAGVGVRLQGDMAVSQAGWLRLSMRSAVFVAARGGVLADGEMTPLGEVVIGEHVWWGERRFTIEAAVGVLDRDDDAELTAMLALGCGWAP